MSVLSMIVDTVCVYAVCMGASGDITAAKQNINDSTQFQHRKNNQISQFVVKRVSQFVVKWVSLARVSNLALIAYRFFFSLNWETL